jgi:hypothetical protein
MDMKDSLNGYPLSEFIENFYGYGNYDGDYWFIGKEEGGGNTLNEIQERLSLWERRGKRELEDIADYHIALGDKRYFTHPFAIQSTWNKLIRMVLAVQQEPQTTDMVRTYQREKLGRLDGDTCLLELLPLPSRSTGEWIYGNSSTSEICWFLN